MLTQDREDVFGDIGRVDGDDVTLAIPSLEHADPHSDAVVLQLSVGVFSAGEAADQSDVLLMTADITENIAKEVLLGHVDLVLGLEDDGVGGGGVEGASPLRVRLMMLMRRDCLTVIVFPLSDGRDRD